MPKTRLEFDFGISPAVETSMRRLLDFLKDHPSLAYSIDELRSEGLGEPDSIATALKELVLFGALDERIVRDEAYYRYLEDVPEFV